MYSYEKSTVETKTSIGLFGKVGGAILLLSFAVTMLTALLGFEWLKVNDKIWIWLAMFGWTFFYTAFAIFISTLKTVKIYEKPMSFFIIFVFALVGGTILVLSIMYGIGYAELVTKILVPRLLLTLFPVVGIILPIASYTRRKYCAVTFTQEVQAEIVDKRSELHHSRNGHTYHVYSLVWKYYAQGDWRTWSSNIARSPEPRNIGDYATLLINPENPDDAYDAEAESSSLLLTTILCIIFVALGVFGWLVLLDIVQV